MIKLGSHNSWSFAKLKQWYVPAFVCRCQRLNIQEQYVRGVRLFDLRLRLHKNEWFPAHGSARFNVDFYDDLRWLNEQGDVYVRVLLEYNKIPKDFDKIVEQFKIVCSFLEKSLSNIKFFGGEAKCTWNVVYKFRNDNVKIIDKYSSTTSLFKSGKLSIIDDWWPWFYAKFHNKQNYKNFVESEQDGYLFIDFVDMI